MKLEFFSTPGIAHYNAIMLVGIGFFLVFSGLLHLTAALNGWDARIFLFLHTRLRPYSGFFRYLWPLGTTPVAIMLILIIFIPSWQAGSIVALLYLLTAILEWAIKRRVNRPRPFQTLPGVAMSQPKKPRDPSHPSGDSMRVWFLALVFPLAFGLYWPALTLTGTMALIISLGRIALGVHYPLDVVGGAGLGILAAGFTVIGYQFALIS